MKKYPYTEVVDGKEYTYIDMGTYYVTNLETGDRRLVQRQVPFLFGEDYGKFQVLNETGIIRTNEEIKELYNCKGEWEVVDEVTDMSF